MTSIPIGQHANTFENLGWPPTTVERSPLTKINDMESLRSSPITGNLSVIYLEGHSTAGDGGQGVFRWAEGSEPGTYVDNNGTIIVPTGGDGSAAWLRGFEGEVNAAWFGSHPDLADNKPSLQAAVDYCEVSGDSLCIPAGTYAISVGITTIRVSIRGEGRKKTILSVTGIVPTDAIYIQATAANAWGKISDLMVMGNAKAHDGIFAEKQGWTIDNCWVENCISCGINTRGFSTRITNNYVSGCAIGIFDDPVGGNTVVRDNFVRGCETNLMITRGGNHIITGNGFQEATVQEILVNATEAQISGIVIRDNYFEMTNDVPAVNIANGNGLASYPVVVDGNFIIGRVAHTLSAAIVKDLSYLILTNNWISAMPYALSSLDGRGGVISGNDTTLNVGGFFAPGSNQNNYEIGVNRGLLAEKRFKSSVYFEGVSRILSTLVLEDSGGVEAGRLSRFSGDMVVGTGTAGLRFDDSNNELRPVNATTGADTDNLIRLGSAGRRFSRIFSAILSPGGGATIWTSGPGSPEGSVTAPVGSMYTDTSGGAGTTLYVKESGTGDTGWVAK